MHDDIDWRLLDRTLAGEASPEEIARVEAWFDAKPERRAVFQYLKHNAAATSVDVESAWQRVAARTVAVGAGEDARRGAHHRTPGIAVRPSRMSQWWRVAAAVLLVAASAASWRAFARPRVVPDHTLTWREMTVPRGSRASIDLADGSHVVLNAGSRLRYSANMGTGARDVYLDGEGYFVVHHDAARPFRVHAGSAIATDVGTRFAVRAYAGAPEVTVAVAEGAVSLHTESSATADSALLTAGMLGRVDRGGSLSHRRADVARYTGWTEGRLVLDDLTLAAAVPVLERWFNVEIRLADANLGALPVTGEFQSESSRDVLGAIALAMNLEITREHGGFTISRRAGVR